MKIKYIVILLMLFIAINGQQINQVPIGTKGNVLELTISNTTNQSYKNVRYEIQELSYSLRVDGWKKEIGVIKEGENRIVEIIFDLTENAEVSSQGSIKLVIYNGEEILSEKEVVLEIVAPEQTKIGQNYPNPFNPSTVIEYQLKQKEQVRLNVFNMLGQRVVELVNEEQEAGVYKVEFNTARYNLSSGVYVYQLIAGDYKESKKMLLVK